MKLLQEAIRLSKQIKDEELALIPKKQKNFILRMQRFMNDFCISCYRDKARNKNCVICHGKGEFEAPKFENQREPMSTDVNIALSNYESHIRNTFFHLFSPGTQVCLNKETWTALCSEYNKVLITKDGVKKIVDAHELLELNHLDEKCPKLTTGSAAQKRYAKSLRCQVLYIAPTQEEKDFLSNETDAKVVIAKYKNDKRLSALTLEMDKLFRSLSK